ncbi:Lrp/AsnC family transcriptional regulator [Chloroflexota bacterium]
MNKNKRGPNNYSLDELDLRICHEMVTNGQQSSREIGYKLGVPHTTIRRRINRLINNDVIHLIAMPNPKALGYDLWVIIELVVKNDRISDVSNKLLEYKFCYLITESIGKYNIVLGARFKRMEDLTKFLFEELSKINGIERYEVNFLVRPVRFYDYSFLTSNDG